MTGQDKGQMILGREEQLIRNRGGKGSGGGVNAAVRSRGCQLGG